jgi:hypothetical protein
MSQQLALPLETGPEPESALKHAWSHTRLRMPFDVAIHVPALAICLRNMAAAENRRKSRRALRTRLHPQVRRQMMEGMQ